MEHIMGACDFACHSKGKTAKEAFESARSQAHYEKGHDPYSGTIGTKGDFVMIQLPEGADAMQYAYKLIEDNDPRIDDKWGPAGCIHLGGEDWLFFGWAPC